MNKHTILIVDDESRALDILKRYLTPDGYNLILAKNGFQALHFLEQHQVDLVLLDVMMPRMDGFKVCQQIKEDERWQDTLVILITAFWDKEQTEHGKKLGANGFLAKPINKDKLRELVSSMLEAKQQESAFEVAPKDHPLSSQQSIKQQAVKSAEDNYTILIVDDEPMTLDILEGYLTPAGYNFIRAKNGFQALDYLERHQVDLVLLDVMMPRLDGFKVCHQIKKSERWQHIPVILITAFWNKSEKEKGYKLGANGFLTKPIDKQHLKKLVRSMLEANKQKSTPSAAPDSRQVGSQKGKTQQPQKELTPDQGKHTILIVDDEPMALDILEGYLILDGYDIIRATSGFKALDCLAQNQIDLVLLDVMMPRLDGFKICQQIKEDARWQHIPVVLITSMWDKDQSERGRQAGANGFLSKPINQPNLRKSVSSMLGIKH